MKRLRRMAVDTARRRLTASIEDLVRGEEGAAYTLSYVMVFPILMLLVALTVETALAMTSKLGTVHAAYAAARVASVQSSAVDWTTARGRIEAAARQAMTPFASGSTTSEAQTNSEDDDFRAAYDQWVDDPAAAGYIQSKQRDVHQHLHIELEGRPAQWDSEIVVTVTYDYPFRIPGVGRLIGERSSAGGFIFPLTSRVTLENDGPQNESQSLGIGYASDN
ncbi:MAG: TadE/TadG family type IV pilus assembly protein [Planctomycetota bacterium]